MLIGQTGGLRVGSSRSSHCRGGLAFQDPGSKYTYMAFCFIIFVGIHVYASPYTQPKDNHSEAIALAALLVCTTFLIDAPVPMEDARADCLSLLVFAVAIYLLLRINIIINLWQKVRRRGHAQQTEGALELTHTNTASDADRPQISSQPASPTAVQPVLAPPSLPASALATNGTDGSKGNGSGKGSGKHSPVSVTSPITNLVHVVPPQSRAQPTDAPA